MKNDVYIFGSVARGEVERNSDVDVLLITREKDTRREFPETWSVYTEDVIGNYYASGRLFAWHLHLEAKCVFSERDIPFLSALGEPSPYENHKEDFESLKSLLLESLNELREGTQSTIFEIGLVYTALRDIATIASTKILKSPCFSRYSPFLIPINFPLAKDTYNLAIEARLLATRNFHTGKNLDGIKKELIAAPLKEWVNCIEATL